MDKLGKLNNNFNLSNPHDTSFSDHFYLLNAQVILLTHMEVTNIFTSSLRSGNY